ncbi:MAG: LysE family transporter [Parvibaculum sp.]
MFDIGLVANGVAIGMAVAAPIGPVNLIVIRRTLRRGAVTGFLSGTGAAVGDGVFSAIAGFGLTAAMDFVLSYQTILQLIGGFFLLGLGISTFFAHPHLQQEDNETISGAALARIFATTFMLTITNPATMFGFIAIFGGVAGLAAGGGDFGHAATIVASVFAGSLLWWACVSGFVSLFCHRMTDHLLEIVNHVSGGLIITFGLVVLLRVIWRFFAS